MKKRLIALSLFLAFGATTALADGQHYATASTKKGATRLATAEARVVAQASNACYRPARQVRECRAVEGGFSCKAETSVDARTCKRAGWVDEYMNTRVAMAYDPFRTNSASTSSLNWQATPSMLYGGVVRADPGPMAPTPFPAN